MPFFTYTSELEKQLSIDFGIDGLSVIIFPLDKVWVQLTKRKIVAFFISRRRFVDAATLVSFGKLSVTISYWTKKIKT